MATGRGEEDEQGVRPKKDRSKLMCFNCLQYGHYKSECKNPDPRKQGTTQVTTATTLMTRARILAMHEETAINPMWILCDTESPIDIIKNPTMITNIRRARKIIELTGIGGEGVIKINQEGDLLGYGTVYFHQDVAANILSFHNMVKRFPSVVYNKEVKDAFIVGRDDGSHMEFVPSAEGLYHYDFQQSIKRKAEIERAQAMMIQTVEGIQRNFTKREIETAEEARRLYVIMGRPSQKVFEEMLGSGKLINNTVTIQDYRNALEMFGQDLEVLKGKTVRTKPDHIAINVAPKPQPKISFSVLI
jgi:hypothetical protein